MKLDYSYGHFVVHASPRHTPLLRTIPGYRARNGEWRWPATLATATALVRTLKDHPDLHSTGAAKAAVRSIREAREAAMDTKVIVPPSPDELYPFQRQAVALGREVRYLLIADEMGLGKTVEALYTVHDVDGPVLVVCPNSLKHNWADEVLRWTERTPLVVEGSAAKRRKLIAGIDNDTVAIINYEALRTHSVLAPFGKFAREGKNDELGQIPFGAVIADEAHRIVNPAAKQTRALWNVAHQPSVKYRLALTGTPVVNNPDDLWAIMHFLVPVEFAHRGQFRDRYCMVRPGRWGGVENHGIKPAMKNELFSIVDPRMIRRTAEEVLPDLPELVTVTREVSLTPKQKKAYDEMQSHYLTFIDDEDMLAATNPLVMVHRLRTLVAGMPVVEDNEILRLDTPSSKLDELLQIREEHEDPIVVFCEYRKVVQFLVDSLRDKGFRVGEVHGGISTKLRQTYTHEFQDGKLDFMVANKAGSEGFTWTRSRLLVFFERNWSNNVNLQALKRVHRIGQDRGTTIIYLHSPGTIDDAVAKANEMKDFHLQSVLRDRERLKELIS